MHQVAEPAMVRRHVVEPPVTIDYRPLAPWEFLAHSPLPWAEAVPAEGDTGAWPAGPDPAPVAPSAGHAPRRLMCDESGQLYEWSGGRLWPVGPARIGQLLVDRGDTRPGVRSLLPEPGHEAIVRCGDFRALLTLQAAQPERLRDGHRLRVRVRVHEIRRERRLRDVAEEVLEDPSRSGEFALLGEAQVARLGLAGKLPPPGVLARPVRPAPDVLVPGERVFSLDLIDDPTLADEAGAASPRPEAEGGPRADTAEPRRSIPQAFCRPCEFRKTREAVLLEMERERLTSGRLRTSLRRVASRLGRGDEHERWLDRRGGRTLDEQLWGVPPPRGGFSDPRVIEWARETLRDAGYDADALLREWEVFWRRKSA
jgi:hypothetical protein